MTDHGIYYGEYLHLDRLLDAQHLESTAAGEPVHDEMLFIIVHQSYELWFKQILWELDSIIEIFSEGSVGEEMMGTIVARLRRVTRIQKLLIEMIDVLETMTPLDFLDFRDYLYPASGFQSAQFRLVENKLGIRREDRLLLSGDIYTARFDQADRDRVESVEAEPSLFDLVEDWLERTPFLDLDDFHFWDTYRSAVETRIRGDRAVVEDNPNLTEREREQQLEDFETTFDQYRALFDAEKHERIGRHICGYIVFDLWDLLNSSAPTFSCSAGSETGMAVPEIDRPSMSSQLA